MGAKFERTDVLARVSLADLLTAEIGPPKVTGGEPWWGSIDPAATGTGKTPPTHIYRVDGDGVEHFKDFASGRTGTAIDVLIHRRGLDFTAALEHLAAAAGLTESGPPPPPLPRVTKQPPTPEPPSAGFVEWVSDCSARLWTSDSRGAQAARDWLNDRGYSEALLTEWRVGYDPGPRHSSDWPKDRRAEHGIRNMAGVTLPIFDQHRSVTYAQTRSLSPDAGTEFPKYLNPSGVQNPGIGVWSRATRLAGAPILIVEGPTDALAVRQAGLEVAGLIGAGHAANPRTASALIETFGRDRPFVVMTDHLTPDGDTDVAGQLAGQWMVTNLWAEAAPAIYAPPPLPGDVSDWLRSHPQRFRAEFADHVAEGLTRLSAATHRALAGDESFIEIAAAGPLNPQISERWPERSPVNATASPSRPQARSVKPEHELGV